jgi:cytochrome P450
VVEFDHHSRAVGSDPVAAYSALRSQCPVFWTESHGGYWVLTKYDDVTAALGDPERFSSARRDDAGGPGSSVSIPKRPSLPQYPLELDPPDNKPYRRILNSLLSPAASERMRPAVRDRVEWCVDQFIERGEADLGYELASAVPASFTIDWLGLPHDAWPDIAKTMHNVSSQEPGSPAHQEAMAGFKQMYGDLTAAIAARQAAPQDDAISAILRNEVDGQPIPADSVLSIVALLVAGGVDTVTALATQALVWLSENRDEHARLLDDPEYMRTATDEFLRIFSPAQALARTISEETEVRGCPMHDGDRLLISFASANRDDEMFEDPNDILLERFPNKHVAFGMGVHRCVGANIARVMFEEIVRGVLRRIPDYMVDTAALQPYFSQGLFTGWQTVPATFTPQPSTGIPLDVHAFRVTAA